MRSSIAALCILLASLPVLAVRVDVPSLPPSPYADAEATTNVAFGAGISGDNVFALSLVLDVSPSNNVEVAFGCDMDENETLDDSEVAFVVGWDCGEWFFRDVVADVTDSCIGSCGHVNLDWTIRFDSARTPRSLRACIGETALPFHVTESMYDPAWNMARVTMRGLCGSEAVVRFGAFTAPLFIRIR